LRINEQETRITHQEHDVDDFDDDGFDDNPKKRWRDQLDHEDQGTETCLTLQEYNDGDDYDPRYR
jgi:hypothetical protein